MLKKRISPEGEGAGPEGEGSKRSPELILGEA